MARKMKSNDKRNRKRQKGGQTGNFNALKHCGYSDLPIPDEEQIYQIKKEMFSKKLGRDNEFDNLVNETLSHICAKFDIAMSQDTPPEAFISLGNEILRLLKSLKETRDTKDKEEGLKEKNPADFLEELLVLDEKNGFPKSIENQREKIHELEMEVNDLRQKLDMPPREDIFHKIESCSHCRSNSEHKKNIENQWVCLSCGWVIENEGGIKNGV